MTNIETSFESLGLNKNICKTCEKIEWKTPTKIQNEVIPIVIKGRDLIGVAETGSGKTGAYALPILHSLLQGQAVKYFGLVLAPTRELAIQVYNCFEQIGKYINVKSVVLVGKMNVDIQIAELKANPHILIATPGRLLHLLEEVPEFKLDLLKYIVFDEADKLLERKFTIDIHRLLKYLPKKRRTLLFSATLNPKVEALGDLVLQNPLMVQINSIYTLPISLEHNFVKVSQVNKDLYLVDILSQNPSKFVIIFCNSCLDSLRISYILNKHSFCAFPINSKMHQSNRNTVLENFREKKVKILVATDIISRGVDVPHVDWIINYDVPALPITYVHRAGRTARAGKGGKSICLLSKAELSNYLEIENLVGNKFPQFPMKEAQTLKQIYGERFLKIQDLTKTKMEEVSCKLENDNKVYIFDNDDWDSQHLVYRTNKYKRMRKQ